MRKALGAAVVAVAAALAACSPTAPAAPADPAPTSSPLDPSRTGGLPPAVGFDVVVLGPDGDLSVHRLGDR